MRPLVLALLLLVAAGCAPARESNHANGEEAGRARDPVCGMMVVTAGARSDVYRGRTYHFCSRECEERFQRDRASYVR
jgi:YHS domain-containing protein